MRCAERTNAQVNGAALEQVAGVDASGMALLRDAADIMHLAEALSYRALTDEVRRAA